MRLDQDSPLYFIKRENKCNNNIIYIMYILVKNCAFVEGWKRKRAEYQNK